MFRSTNNKGFTLSFQNGWTISVQFGYGNYCSNGHHPEGYFFSKEKDVVESNDAEIAIWDGEGKWYDFGVDTVKGYCTVDEVGEWIEKVRNFS